ncbi:hypothetical protein JZU56_02390 [bacterium]|nr:hypothetical protein [bacterium]
MTQQELSQANDPDLRTSLQAMKRAADLARKTALQTDTGIVIVQNDKIVWISAEQLRHERKT